MTRSHVALALLLACTPALAQDDPPKKPDPAPPAGEAPKPAAAPEGKAERKVDPAATKALERHVGLVALPSAAGIKEIAGKGDLDQNDMTIGINPKWSQEKGFDVSVSLPPELLSKLPPGVTEDMVGQTVKQQMGQVGLNSVFEAPGRNWAHYNVALKQTGDDQVVDLTPFDDQADAASRQYTFGKDGLLKKTSMSPKVDPNNPQSAMMAGMTFDVEWKYEKKGERSVLASRSLSVMGQDIETTFTYYEGPNGSFLAKEATISSPQGEQVIKFHDYVVDGKLVESTKTDAAKPAAKPAEKPQEKDAVKPAENPPAPAPKEPAPKEAGK